MKPCPFCGLDDELEIITMADLDLHDQDGYWKGEYFVHCDTCSAKGPYDSTKEKAVEHWDKRN